MSVRLYTGPAQLSAGALTVTDRDHHYLFRVLRLTVGNEVVVFDGNGRVARAVIENIDARTASLAVEEPTLFPRPQPEVISYLPLLKGERMDFCIQKLAELGSDHIVPIDSDRCVVRIKPGKQPARVQRWQHIAVQAASQCRSTYLPTVHNITPFGDAVASCRSDLRLLFWESDATHSLKLVLEAHRPTSVALLTGPEGGFSVEEVEQATGAGFSVAGLGPRILRAETAALTALSCIDFAYDR